MYDRNINLPNSLECPQCGRHSIVRHGDNRWSCLSCNFTRDLDRPSQDDTLNWFVVLLALAIALGMLVELSDRNRRTSTPVSAPAVIESR